MQVLQIDTIFDSMNRKFANPTTLIYSVFVIGIAALLVIGQDQRAQAQESSGGVTADDIFKYFGYLSLGLSALACATAAVYATLRRSALTEWKELAESRKGKIVELALEIEKLKAANTRLEADLEDLEKKNLRLQDEKKG